MTYIRVGSGFVIYISVDRNIYGFEHRVPYLKKNVKNKKDFWFFVMEATEEKSKILMQTRNSVVNPRFGKYGTALENCSQHRYTAFIYDMSANFCSAQYAVSTS